MKMLNTGIRAYTCVYALFTINYKNQLLYLHKGLDIILHKQSLQINIFTDKHINIFGDYL